MWALGFAGTSSESLPPRLQDAGWEGCFFSRGGLLDTSAVMFDEQPETKNVRSKAVRILAAKAQAVVGARDVRYVV